MKQLMLFDIPDEPVKLAAHVVWRRRVRRIIQAGDDAPLFFRRARGSPMTAEEQEQLAAYLPLIRATARRAHLRGIRIDDLEGELIAYACHIMPRFDPTRAKLGSLLRVALSNKIKNMIRDQGKKVRLRTDQGERLAEIARDCLDGIAAVDDADELEAWARCV
jgi:hypothetical protein